MKNFLIVLAFILNMMAILAISKTAMLCVIVAWTIATFLCEAKRHKFAPDDFCVFVMALGVAYHIGQLITAEEPLEKMKLFEHIFSASISGISLVCYAIFYKANKE